MSEIPVLIIGGGPAGLTAVGLLALNGIKATLLEKHEKVSLHPRAVGFTTRTMEIFDTLGVADKVPQTTADFRLRRIQIESLAGKWGEELGHGNRQAQSNMVGYSQYLGAAIAQDKLDVILRHRVAELGCDVRYGHRMLDFTLPQDGSAAIDVRVRDPDGKEYVLSTKYLLGADGHKSLVRESLGIHMNGRGYLSTLQSVLFRAPTLDKYLEKGFHQFAIQSPGNNFRGFLTTYNDSRWVLMAQDGKVRTDDELREAIVTATGIPDLEYEFITTGLWDLSARIADSFSYSIQDMPRIFLLGDAAHTLPPTRGGYGANTGIADAHNIAWKLASVLSGRSNVQLLQSYHEERRPVAWLRHQQTFAGPDYARYRKEGDDYGSVIDGVAMELGQVYHSDIIVEDVTSREVLAQKPEELKGLPGSRAPHVWLRRQEKEVSSLKLFENCWTIVTSDRIWAQGIAAITKELGISLQIICPGLNDIDEVQRGDIAEKFGLSAGGASLVRPDGFVSWRSGARKDGDDSTQDLIEALKRSASM